MSNHGKPIPTERQILEKANQWPTVDRTPGAFAKGLAGRRYDDGGMDLTEKLGRGVSAR